MLFNLIAFAFAFLGLAQADPATTCKDFKSAAINYDDLVKAGPLKLTWTNNKDLTCTTGLLTPSGSDYYFMLLQNKMMTYSFAIDGTVTPGDNGITLTACNSSTPYTYKFIQADLTGANPVFIAFICDETTGKVILVKSYCKNPADGTTAAALKQKITDTFTTDTVTGPLVNGWDSTNNCPAYSTCGGFF